MSTNAPLFLMLFTHEKTLVRIRRVFLSNLADLIWFLAIQIVIINVSHFFRGLKNDSSRETFRLSHHTSDGSSFFPCRFVKIVPVQCWGPSFNFSIWYVGLTGDESQETVGPALAWHNEVSGLFFQNHSVVSTMVCFQPLLLPPT